MTKRRSKRIKSPKNVFTILYICVGSPRVLYCKKYKNIPKKRKLSPVLP